ncbi:MAG TPA: hypothetical protein DDW51_01970, partial [Cyanobacteria bacterium UBA11367]|nr:hypothetical protein [Cyanobacteria bacterium UBA11367]
MIVQNSEKTLAIALESLNRVYDELIIVDGGSIDSTCEIALHYGARVIKSEWSGNHGQQRNVYLREIKTDWAFVIDSDEFIDIRTLEYLQSLKSGKLFINTDNFWIPRKWISPKSQKHYIGSSPHYPDFQRRLFQNKEGIFYQGKIHEIVQGFTQPDGCLSELSIYHLDLFINSEEKRREKVRRYSQDDPRNGGRHFYLPNLEIVQLEELDLHNFLPLVRAKLDDIQQQERRGQDKFSNFGLILPEIKDDEFYTAIEKIAKEENIKTILEIGSSSGEGSTEAFVNGMRENANKPTLFCMEVSKTRFAELQNRYGGDGFVKCYNVSSVALRAFPSQDEFIRFYKHNYTNLNFFPLNKVLNWLEQDIAYINEAKVEQNGIKLIKNENNIDFFDAVLIDGSEFTGKAELDEVYGANYILLDDIETFKNYQNFYRLANDERYSLIAHNRYLRNGYAIFKKVSSQLVNQQPSRKVLFSVGVGELAAEFQQFTSPRFQEYANYYGFEYREITEYGSLNEKKQEWIKIDYVIKLLSELQTGELIAFLDANIAIVRGDIELNTYKSIGLAKDSSGALDSGIWVVRVNEFSKRFFEEVWNQNEGDSSPFSEQMALQKVVLELSPQEQENHIEILQNCLNVTLVKGEFPVYDIYRKNPCLELIRFRHFAGGQPWIGKYFSQPVIFNASKSAPISYQRSIQNSIPIVFIHQGDSDYLKYTLSQVKHSNPDSTVFLIGDAANAHYYNLAEFVDIFKYCNEAVEFAKIYQHYNTNSLGYELFCFQRWFILKNFLLENKIDKCLYIDSDVMLYANVAEEENKFKNWDLTLSYETSPHCVFVNKLKTLEDFCNFICEIYTNPSLIKLMESKFEERIQQNLPGGACDMTAFIEYRRMHPSKIGELSTIIDNSKYDHNINLSEGFEMQDGIKNIYFVNGQPCCKDLKFGNPIKFNCLHFQGNAKKYIKKYCLGGNLLAKIEILPVHFFTIVLNGEPFIRYHIEIFKQL